MDPASIIASGDMQEYLKGKQITYTGEVGNRCQPLSWPQLEAALPPAERCAAINILDICEGPVLHYLMHPERSLRELEPGETCPVAGKMHVLPGEMERIGRGLLRRRLVHPVLEPELVLADCGCGSVCGIGELGIAKAAAFTALF